MRLIPAFYLVAVLCSASVGATAETIVPGSNLVAAKATFEKYGFEVDARKYGLAMAASDPDHALEFCPLDAHITLVITYHKATKKIESLEIVIIPDHAPKSQRQQISREVLAMGVEEGGVYTLKMRREANQ